MKIEGVVPKENYLVVRKEESANKVGSLEVAENTDDFLVHAEVIKSHTSSLYAPGVHVIFHQVDGVAFRDGGSEYLIVNEDFVLGVYHPNC